jgi:hypothetical protein
MKLVHAPQNKKIISFVEKEKAIHAANILGRTFEEVLTYMMPLVQ